VIVSKHWRPWGKQDQALFSFWERGSRVTIFAAGIQSGKTTVGVQWLRLLMLAHAANPQANFIITSPSFRILEQSTLPPFLNVMDGLGTFHRQGMYFKMTNGPTCWMRTATDPNSVVGITDVYGILSDEAGLYPRYFWDNIMARAAFKQAPIMVVTSPYSQNWLYLDYVRHLEKKPDSIDGVTLIQARSDENPYFPKAEYERQSKLMDKRRFDMVFGGQFGRMEGLVYDAFDEAENTCPEQSLPVGTQIYCGVDWGVRHAFVLHVRAITADGHHYQVAEVYRSGLNPMDMVAAARSVKLAWGVRTFYADPSQPGMIDLFCANGLPTVGAENDIRLGIGYHYELVKTRKFKIFEGRCPYSLDQYSTYHYPSPQDLKPDQDEKEVRPVKTNDDAMDAARYCTIMTYKAGEPKRPVKTDEAPDPRKMHHSEFFESLKKKKRHVEAW
jgi:PBSX family phage terminase large subunit